jgi:putative FmdB family regulatory protein
MPFYEYRCSDCLSQFELLRNITQRDNSAECPDCGSAQNQRQVTAAMAFAAPAAGNGRVKAVAGTSGCGGCSANSCAGCPSG